MNAAAVLGCGGFQKCQIQVASSFQVVAGWVPECRRSKTPCEDWKWRQDFAPRLRGLDDDAIWVRNGGNCPNQKDFRRSRDAESDEQLRTRTLGDFTCWLPRFGSLSVIVRSHSVEYDGTRAKVPSQAVWRAITGICSFNADSCDSSISLLHAQPPNCSTQPIEATPESRGKSLSLCIPSSQASITSPSPVLAASRVPCSAASSPLRSHVAHCWCCLCADRGPVR